MKPKHELSTRGQLDKLDVVPSLVLDRDRIPVDNRCLALSYLHLTHPPPIIIHGLHVPHSIYLHKHYSNHPQLYLSDGLLMQFISSFHSCLSLSVQK